MSENSVRFLKKPSEVTMSFKNMPQGSIGMIQDGIYKGQFVIRGYETVVSFTGLEWDLSATNEVKLLSEGTILEVKVGSC